MSDRSGSGYEAILFDFDGVLVDSEPIHYQCWREILTDFGIDLDWDTYARTCIGVADRVMLQRMSAVAPKPVTVEELAATYPVKKARYRAAMEHAMPFAPGISELLKSLSHYKLGVVSSSERSEVEPFLERAGLMRYFGVTVCGYEAGALKPAPDPYLYAARHLGVSRALVVEDSDTGESSARAAGFDVIRVNSPLEVRGALLRRLEQTASISRSNLWNADKHG